MPKWLIGVDGDQSSLDDLARLIYKHPDISLIARDGRRFLNEAGIDSVDEIHDVYDKANMLVEKANRATGLMFDGFNTLRSTGLCRLEHDGKLTQFLFPGGVALSIVVGSGSVTIESPTGKSNDSIGADGNPTINERLVVNKNQQNVAIAMPTPADMAHYAPSAVLLQRISQGTTNIDDLSWRQFEQLIAELLERDGYSVELGPGRSDGGKDLIAKKSQGESGLFVAVWQAKKNSKQNKVKIETIRELAFVRDENRASKGIIVTTSHLTRGAIALVQQREGALGKVDRTDLENWLRRS